MTPNERNGSGAGEGADRDPQLDRVYRAGASEEPPAHLDAAILAAARREVGARPRAVSARLRAWRVPVSIAAVVVLSVSLATLVQEEGGGKLEQSTAMLKDSKLLEKAPASPAAAPETAKAPAGSTPPATKPAAKDDAAPGTSSSAKIAENTARREDRGRTGHSELQSAVPGAGPSPQPFQGAPAAPERRQAFATDQAAGAGTMTQPAAPRASEADASATRGEPAPAPRSNARMMQRDRAAAEDVAGSLSAAPPPAAVAPAEKPQPSAEVRALKREPVLADTTRTTRVAGLVKEMGSQPPEKWLERIEALRREGRKEDADELLAEFKRRYPTHPLPSGLR